MRSFPKSISAILFSSALAVATARAQVWTGATNGKWSDNTNWSAALVSGNATRITFGANANTTTTQDHGTNPFILNSLTFNDNAAFIINPANPVNPLQFEKGGTPAVEPQIVNNGTKDQNINVPIKINSSTLTLGGAGSGKMLFNGVIDQVGGNRAVVINGSGQYVLGDSATGVQNLYKGGTTLQSGTLVIDNTQALGPSGSLSLKAGTVRASTTASYMIANPVSIDGGSVTFGSNATANTLGFSGLVTLTSDTTITCNNSVTSFLGGMTDGGVATKRALTVAGDATVKDGPKGTKTLNGGRLKVANNTSVNGPVTIQKGGAVLLPGLAFANFTSGVTIQAGGIIGGNGRVGSPAKLFTGTGKVLFQGGSFFKCQSDGALDVDGGVDFQADSVFVEDIAGLVPGDDYTQLNVTDGAGEIDPGAILDINVTAPLSNGDTFDIMTRDSAAQSLANQFSNFDGMTLAEGSTFSADGYQFRINYGAVAGTSFDTGGNDVRLTVVPEPSVSLLLAAVAIVGRRRIRRRERLT